MIYPHKNHTIVFFFTPHHFHFLILMNFFSSTTNSNQLTSKDRELKKIVMKLCFHSFLSELPENLIMTFLTCSKFDLMDWKYWGEAFSSYYD